MKPPPPCPPSATNQPTATPQAPPWLCRTHSNWFHKAILKSGGFPIPPDRVCDVFFDLMCVEWKLGLSFDAANAYGGIGDTFIIDIDSKHISCGTLERLSVLCGRLAMRFEVEATEFGVRLIFTRPAAPKTAPPCPATQVLPGPPRVLQTGTSSPLIQECGTCRFWADNYMNETGVAGGFCRRRPPARHGFPEVLENWWCGSYQFNESLFEKPPQNESRCCAFGGAPQVPAPAAISRQENADNAAMHCNESHFVRN